MTFEIIINKEIIYWTMGLIIWFLLPFITDLKTFMTPKETRSNVLWFAYAILVALPNLVVIFTLSFTIKFFNFLVNILDKVVDNLMYWIFPDEKR